MFSEQLIAHLRQRPLLVLAAVCVLAGAGVLAWPQLQAQHSPAASPLLLASAPAAQALGAPEQAGLLVEPTQTGAPAPAAIGTPSDPTSEPLEEPAEAIIVYISGAVAAPGVYRLPVAARAIDVVLLAGGPSASAATAAINLAAPLHDAQHLHIPSHAELDADANAANRPMFTGNTSLATARDPAAPAGSPDEPASNSGVGLVADGKIDLNSASASELEELPGIGPALAGRIVAYREEVGGFASIDELRNVSGIGERVFGEIAALLVVGE